MKTKAQNEIGDLGYTALTLGRIIPPFTALGSLFVDNKIYGAICLGASILTYTACVLHRPEYRHKQSQ
jgi:hypothetical protein